MILVAQTFTLQFFAHRGFQSEWPFSITWFFIRLLHAQTHVRGLEPIKGCAESITKILSESTKEGTSECFAPSSQITDLFTQARTFVHTNLTCLYLDRHGIIQWITGEIESCTPDFELHSVPLGHPLQNYVNGREPLSLINLLVNNGTNHEV